MKKSIVFICSVLLTLAVSLTAFGQSRHRHGHVRHAAAATRPDGDLCRHLVEVLNALTEVGEPDLRERVARALAARCRAPSQEGQRAATMDDNITGLSPNRPDGLPPRQPPRSDQNLAGLPVNAVGPVPPPPCQDRPAPPPPEGSEQCPSLDLPGLSDGNMGPSPETLRVRMRIRAQNNCPPIEYSPPQVPLPRGSEPPI